MKKLLVLLFAFCGCAAVLNAQTPNVSQKLNTALKKKLAASSSTNAHKKGVIMIRMTVQARFTDVYANNDPIVKKCPAVRISPNALLASRACIDLSGKGEHIVYMGNGVEPQITTQRVQRWISSIKVAGVTIKPRDFRQEGKLLLIAIDGTNAKLKKEIEKLPITDLFVAKDAKKLETTFPEMILNRDDMIFSGRECAEVDIVNVCTGTQCFQVCWKVIDGDTGDPVFGRNPNRSNLDYLLGFNNTNSKKDERKSGRWYHFLTQNSLHFLQKSLPASEWNYIRSHVKDETIYK
ncbi:hypothetical protein [Candidatus Avelusimicrobium stercoris]|uniref:hypothetical protein n=1 Tax=Candidatus Avelusimicrobium stercoris TaxID=1947924 RepID=UPI003D0CD784